MSKIRAYALALSAAAIMLPSAAQAIGLNSNATMTATCSNADCDYIRFVLTFDAGFTVQDISIHSDDVSKFYLGSIVQVKQGTSVLNSTTDYDPNSSGIGSRVGLQVNAYPDGDFTSPLVITVAMGGSDTGTSGDLTDGTLWFDGDACYGDACSQSFPTRTNVTPEPVTMALLGTGLAGLAGVGARRKKRFPTESE